MQMNFIMEMYLSNFIKDGSLKEVSVAKEFILYPGKKEKPLTRYEELIIEKEYKTPTPFLFDKYFFENLLLSMYNHRPNISKSSLKTFFNNNSEDLLEEMPF